jgi:hypothetical protein
MLCCIQWLQQNGVAVQALATVVLVCVTGAYVVLTLKLVRATEQMRIAGVRPLVVLEKRRVVLPEGRPTESATLVNIGLGPALDVVYQVRDHKDASRDPYAINKENRGYAIGVPPDNSVRLQVGSDAADGVVRGSLDFEAEYRDVHGNLYHTTIAKRTVNTGRRRRPTLAFPAQPAEQGNGLQG